MIWWLGTHQPSRHHVNLPFFSLLADDFVDNVLFIVYGLVDVIGTMVVDFVVNTIAVVLVVGAEVITFRGVTFLVVVLDVVAIVVLVEAVVNLRVVGIGVEGVTDLGIVFSVGIVNFVVGMVFGVEVAIVVFIVGIVVFIVVKAFVVGIVFKVEIAFVVGITVVVGTVVIVVLSVDVDIVVGVDIVGDNVGNCDAGLRALVDTGSSVIGSEGVVSIIVEASRNGVNIVNSFD